MAAKAGSIDTGLSVSLIESGDSSSSHNEVVVPVKSRRFTAQYKLKVLRAVENLSPGERGEYLRKHGLYSSHLCRWRKQAEDGSLGALSNSKPGRKVTRDYNAEQVSRLQKEVDRLKGKLKQAETIIEVQKKLSDLLGIQMPENSKKDM